MFPERQEFKDTLPKLFLTFKSIRASVDCTDFKFEKPRNYPHKKNKPCLNQVKPRFCNF